MTLEILKSVFPLGTPVSMQMEKHCEGFLERVIHNISVLLGSLRSHTGWPAFPSTSTVPATHMVDEPCRNLGSPRLLPGCQV